jgi:hypothetical protein
MSLEFEEQNERATTVKKDGKRVGVITDTANGFGYRVFGSPVAGTCDTLDEAKSEVKKHLA